MIPPRSGPMDTGLGLLAGLMLLAAIALGFLPGQAGVPPLDRDEPRYTQATKQMLETGDYVRIRFQDAPRHKKPVGIHWLQAAAAKASGLGADAPLWVYRIPSLLGALSALLLSVWVARAFLPMPLALAVGAIFGATIILGVEARLAKTDAVLLATILLAQGALARLWLSERRPLGTAVLFWLALGAGILVKGPIAPMVCGLTIAALALADRRRILSNLRFVIGIPIAAAVCLPWYLAIYAATDGAFFVAAVGKDFLGKAAGGQEGHGAPPLTHIGLFLAVGWPLAPLAIAALWRAVRMRSDAILFAAAWVVPAWIVFELTPTKLPHYTLPLLPGIALATVASLAAATPPRALKVLAGALVLAAPLGVLGAAVMAPFIFAQIGAGDPSLVADFPQVTVIVLAALAAAAGLAAAVAIWRGARLVSPAVLAPVVAASVIAQATIWGIALPATKPIWISPRLVAAAAEAAPCASPRIISVGGFNEPSLVFLSGTNTALLTAEEAAEAVTLSGEGCAVIAARGEAVATVRAAALAKRVTLFEAGHVTGFNISKGDPIDLTLFQRAR
ncbi:glycosyltransferase family 39 protein [Acuticoccus sp. MNP-M23]|uniref:ArnT family glycosyltransferase n=1 Tax=Acuticoccus sp. MNP-M23 TaxID=3072793 RepID=UPI0028149DD0|nr:glycosyltransferase family 39 protein [Acuticoccus sp. MNP-M23]WMS42950.1 glycosyltransferase family 39 protein [Acuticoccus sp. MNP-M23]